MLPVDGAGKQMLDFTSKIEHSRGNTNKTVYWHIQKTVKRGTAAHTEDMHVDVVRKQRLVIRQVTSRELKDNKFYLHLCLSFPLLNVLKYSCN